MRSERDVSRRGAVVAGVGFVMGTTALAQSQGKIDPDKGVTATEDLMKEHGVLNRCLLIYEEGMRRLRDGEKVRPTVFLHTAELIRHFVEEYHEKNEETVHIPRIPEARKDDGPRADTAGPARSRTHYNGPDHPAGGPSSIRIGGCARPDRPCLPAIHPHVPTP